jgi:ferric-dicitrate binding protein FerR (iron transport regulator)
MDINQAKALLKRYRAGDCTPQEKMLVEQWYAQLVETGEWQWGEGEKQEMEKTMEARLMELINTTNNVSVTPVHRIHLLRRARWWAAASIILLLSTGAYFLFFNQADKTTEIAKKDLPDDVKAPQTNRAMITLANGQRVYLDSVSNGQLALQGNIKLVKLANGQVAYLTTTGEIVKELQYNTLTNPRGSKVIDITLADGSRVWLNSGSSVTYPVAFTGTERKVSIIGEAYFEVAKNVAMPFKVKKINSDIEVQVLGTHFNMNAYDDEPSVKVTLLEGSVNVTAGKAHNILKPGQQAQLQNSEVSIVNNVDLAETMAWKNGRFYFDGTDIKTIMRQIEKWYNVEVKYQAEIRYSFVARVSRDVPVSELLKLLELTEGVHFKINDNTIVVTK